MQEEYHNPNSIKQIICFINPGKFRFLLGDHKANALGYIKDGIALNNSQELVYINNINTEIGRYDEEKASSAEFLLIPDTLKLDYIPTIPFKVLFHNETNKGILKPLRSNSCYRGELLSMEQTSVNNIETPYNKIATAIPSISVTEIEQLIPYYDIILEVKLEVLHACLTPVGAKKCSGIDNFDLIQYINVKWSKNGLEKSQNVNWFIGEQLASKSDCFSEDYIDSLSSLKAALLGE